MPVVTGGRVVGLREADNALQRLSREYGPQNARQAFRVPTRRALMGTRDEIERTTPVDSGRLQEATNIRVGIPNKYDRQNNSNAVYVGRVGWFWPTSETQWFKALAVEFGTRFQPAQATVRNALTRNAQDIVETFSRELGRNINATANRLAARQRAGRLRRR